MTARQRALVQSFGALAGYAAIPLLVLNVVRGILIRSLPVALLSAGLTGAGFGLVFLNIDYTLAYCLLDGVKLPGCLLGCAH